MKLKDMLAGYVIGRTAEGAIKELLDHAAIRSEFQGASAAQKPLDEGRRLIVDGRRAEGLQKIREAIQIHPVSAETFGLWLARIFVLKLPEDDRARACVDEDLLRFTEEICGADNAAWVRRLREEYYTSA